MKRLSALALVALAACNEPPTAPTVSISPANPKTDAELKANIVSPASDPQGDPVVYGFAWLKDGAPQADLVTDAVPAARTARGEVWTAVVTPGDGTLSGPAAQAQVTIANTPPTATLAFLPPDPAKGTALKVVASGTDVDGDTVTFTYAWTKNGTATAFVTDTVPANELSRGQAWQVTVTPNDGTEAGPPVTGSVTVGNAKPVVASVALSPQSPTKANALSAQPTAPMDEDGDTVTLKYAWAVNGTAVDGQAGPNLATTYFQKGQVVTVTVTPNDGKEDGAPATASAVIGNSPPTAPLPGINARPKDSEEVTCALVVSSTDLDSADTVSYAFTWTKNGQPFSGGTVQGNSSVIAAALTAEGDLFACSVAATDGTATVPGSVVASTKVNARPVVSSVTLTPAVPTKATSITAQPAPSTDADSDVVTLRYQWLVNGSVDAGVSGSSLSPSKFVKGDTVAVVVTPNDGIEDGTPATASTVVGNSPPTAPVATITPAPRDADDVTCSVGVSSADLDLADTVSYAFTWTKNGQPFSGATVQGTSSTVVASLTGDGDVFTCAVAATDGMVTTSGNTVATTVRNTYASCKAVLQANSGSADGLYVIDPDGAGGISPVTLFCDMANGGWSLVANIYDSAGDDAPNSTDYVVSGWQQTASGQWSNAATKVERNSSGTGSSAVSLAFVAALKASASQQHLKMCFVHQNGTDTTCRSSSESSMTLVSYPTGNPKLTVYSGNTLPYTYGRLAGLAGSVDGYGSSTFDHARFCVPRTVVPSDVPGTWGDTSLDPNQPEAVGLCEHSSVNANDGVWTGWGSTSTGAAYKPWAVSDGEIGNWYGANPSINSYGFRLYVGP